MSAALSPIWVYRTGVTVASTPDLYCHLTSAELNRMDLIQLVRGIFSRRASGASSAPMGKLLVTPPMRITWLSCSVDVCCVAVHLSGGGQAEGVVWTTRANAGATS